jgi:hypothetical protein
LILDNSRSHSTLNSWSRHTFSRESFFFSKPLDTSRLHWIILVLDSLTRVHHSGHVCLITGALIADFFHRVFEPTNDSLERHLDRLIQLWEGLRDEKHPFTRQKARPPPGSRDTFETQEVADHTRPTQNDTQCMWQCTGLSSLSGSTRRAGQRCVP